jgi:hypothetical protein
MDNAGSSESGGDVLFAVINYVTSLFVLHLVTSIVNPHHTARAHCFIIVSATTTNPPTACKLENSSALSLQFV